MSQLRMYRSYSKNGASAEAWKAILRLAHLWKCDEIRELAFSELDHLLISPLERVVLTTQYDANVRVCSLNVTQCRQARTT